MDKNNGHFEISFIGRLVGHLNLIIAAQYSQELDMLVSIDDKMNLRFWDLVKRVTISSI